MNGAALTLRSFQILRQELFYLEEVTSKRTHFTLVANPYKKLPRSNLVPSLITARQRYKERLGIPIRLALRFTHLMLIFGPATVLYAALMIVGPTYRYRIIFQCLKRAGGAFTKLGQWASTRPDILPGQLCQALSELHARASAHEMSWNRHVFRAEFGVEIEDIFERFEEVPTGSGTIAQVHLATLRSNGQEVAVKVCHPNIEDRISHDLILMAIGSEVINLVPAFKAMNLPEEISQFSRIMRTQVDLRYEAYTLGHLSRNFSTWTEVFVPIPIYPIVSRRILAQTFAHGTSIGRYAAASNLEESLNPVELEVWVSLKRRLATIGLQSFLQMLLWDNFVHADLHPGNILVRFVNKHGQVRWDGPPSVKLIHQAVQDDLIPQLVYLDTGLITQLSRKDFQNFNDLFIALVLHGDGFRAGELIIERCPDRHKVQIIDSHGFCTALDNIVRPIFKDVSSLKLGSFAITPVLFKVFDLVRRHHVHLDGSFTNLVMSFVCVEGLGRQLSPDLNLIPFLARAALQYLITNVGRGEWGVRSEEWGGGTDKGYKR